jgi:hypothetical protein
VAGDASQIYQAIEGCNLNDANFGSASALPVTLEFWVYSTLSGTFAGCLQNFAETRSYVFTYTVTANSWQKFRIAIPGDTVGTWTVAANAGAAYLIFNLGAGSTYSHAAGAWAAGNFFTAPGAVNPVATANAKFWITGVALMVGAAAANAEPEFRNYSDNLLDCQRYFFNPSGTTPIYGSGYCPAPAGLSAVASRSFPVTMRSTPTQVGGVPFNQVNANTPTVAILGTTGMTWSALNTAAGVFQLGVQNDTYDADF